MVGQLDDDLQRSLLTPSTVISPKVCIIFPLQVLSCMPMSTTPMTPSGQIIRVGAAVGQAMVTTSHQEMISLYTKSLPREGSAMDSTSLLPTFHPSTGAGAQPPSIPALCIPLAFTAAGQGRSHLLTPILPTTESGCSSLSSSLQKVPLKDTEAHLSASAGCEVIGGGTSGHPTVQKPPNGHLKR